MKLANDFKDYDVEASDGLVGGQVSIDTSNLGMFYEMMSKSIYSNPIGSIVRELTSNCFDSHKEAKVNKPVIIKGFHEEGNYWIGFEDFGVGMSPQRFQDIYLKYMSSTKRDSNEQLGMWGLGSKSPFSYTDVFYIRTRFDGIEYYYIMSKGQQGIPEWDKMYEKPTTECNGTQVKFIVEGGGIGSTDWHKFSNEINDQLTYFDDVWVEGFGINNEYTILEYKTFKHRKDTLNSEMHILLGKVKYPVDWGILGINEINIPVGVKFDIGELLITPNRESIRYNDDTIANIKAKVEGCTNELKEIMASSAFDDLDKMIAATRNQTKYILLDDDTSIPIYEGNYGIDIQKSEIIRYPFDIPIPQFRPFIGTPIRVPMGNPFFFLRTVGVIDGGSYRAAKDDTFDRRMPHNYKEVYQMIKESTTPIFRTNDFKVNRMKSEFVGSGILVSVNNSIKFKTKMRSIGLDDYKKSPFNKRTLIEHPIISVEHNKTKLYLLYKKVMLGLLIKQSKSYDRLEIPSEFQKEWRERNQANRSSREDDELSYYTCTDGLEEKTTHKLKELRTSLVVYTSNKNRNYLKAAHILLKNRRWGNPKLELSSDKHKAIIINLRDFKKMEGEKNATSLEDLLNGKSRILVEQATAYYLYSRWENLDLDFAIDYIPQIKQWHDTLGKFISKTTKNSSYEVRTAMNTEIVKTLIKTMEEYGLLLKEYIDLANLLTFIEEDLKLLRVCSIEAETPDEKREVASYFIKKGYKVDPVYVFVPNEQEVIWMKEADTYCKYTKEIRSAWEEVRFSSRLHRLSYRQREQIENSKPIKLCQTDYPKSFLSKSARTSMLVLMEHLIP